MYFFETSLTRLRLFSFYILYIENLEIVYFLKNTFIFPSFIFSLPSIKDEEEIWSIQNFFPSFYDQLLLVKLYFILSLTAEDEEDFDVEEEDNMYVPRMSQPDPTIDTSRVEEIPAKEPKFHAVPLKSVLKKRGSGSGPGTPQNTPTQENRPLTLRQELHASFKLVRDQTTDFLDEQRPTLFRASHLFFFERLDGGGERKKREKKKKEILISTIERL